MNKIKFKETEKKVINSFWHGVGVGIGIGAAVVVLTQGNFKLKKQVTK